MELVLNVLWLVIASASVCLWQRQWRRSKTGHRRRDQSLGSFIALCCALFVLFPVISLTDDLHNELVVIEEWNSLRRTLRAGGDHPTRSSSGELMALPAHTVLPDVFFFRGVIVGRVFPTAVRPHTLILAGPSEGRAPPSSIL